jgi:hypothetical protein
MGPSVPKKGRMEMNGIGLLALVAMAWMFCGMMGWFE